MEWIPKGPNFVFQPRVVNYTRLSLYNEKGFQGRVESIVIDPNNQHIIYVLERPSEKGGITIYRKREDILYWDAITDSLRDDDPYIDPSCIAVNPNNSSIIYVGTYHNGKVYRGQITIGLNGKATVNWPRDVNGTIIGVPVGVGLRKIILDVRQTTPNNTAGTHLFAASATGIHYSDDDGGNWRGILEADITSMIGYFPHTDTSKSHIYAGCYMKGVYYTDSVYNDLDPNPDSTDMNRSRWRSLSTGGNMLPQHDLSGNFDYIRMENTPLNPNRIYVWLLNNGGQHTVGLYTTSTPTIRWTPVVNDPMTLPQPAEGYGIFGVSPNSSGDGNGEHDILFFGDLALQRSTNGGRTWSAGNADFHPDIHAIAFFPHNTTPADVYIGCDGGIAYCPNFADPDPAIRVDPIFVRGFEGDPRSIRLNQNDITDGHDGQFRNLNHGKRSSIIYAYSSHPEISTLEYIACQDTGLSAGSGTSCWRGLQGSDIYDVAVAPGSDGIKVWANTGMYNTIDEGWPNIRLTVLTDKGSFGFSSSHFPTLPSTGSNLSVSSNIVISGQESWSGCCALESMSDSKRLVRPIYNTMNRPIPWNAYPNSMSGIDVGSRLIIDERNDYIEEVKVTLTGTDSNGDHWFRAEFSKPHDVDANIRLMKSVVVSVDVSAAGLPRVTQKGQDFGLIVNPDPDIRRVERIGISQNPDHSNRVCCATNDKKLWIYDDKSNHWNEVQAPRSLPSSFNISSISVNYHGEIFWLLEDPVTLGSIRTALFKFDESQDPNLHLGQWKPQFLQFTHLVLPVGEKYKKLVTHPQLVDTLFLSHGMKVLKLTWSNTIGPATPASGGWECEDISLNLPKQPVNDLWIGEIKRSERRNVLLRAVLSTRGIWEADISQTVTSGGNPQPVLYMRDNILDHGWLSRSPPLSSEPIDRISNPYLPEERLYYWHYQCPDIKLDLRHQGNTGVQYYQIDPESPLPFYQTDPGSPYPIRNPPEISYDMFEQIRDNSQDLLELSEAWLHIQVHNYSNIEANNVYVWAIYCNAAAGVPSLNATSGNNSFDFWQEIFLNSPGRISANLPTDGRWQSIGEPRRISGITAENPKVASWKWRIPELSPGYNGHYCIAAFVHSGTNPIRETGANLGVIVSRNSQIAQKNLHIHSVRR
jgi:hypothetical protein